mmetsp:Transcript_2362/g.4722  ORF Transcript_2362/g.4722 Transcript_2362/m.4722 type:complete len:451 (-) Transcript_2362:59-1411(-)|eukprot:CAMPEP_0201659036 /NCGR_PEP_ID=MMETSP0494-20130426/1884_1 /ASSEMBLY_ACC=CAM_ASM_000839 /TAXON_ID=420259 /ORGANISM="Thalassiosira gravida, Strain GMp14c1" /LENGTH=450 /DNA_ID=CAMNT_0048136363 /DNA_START=326 /DNA_END=1678 /DNA_ORIENTATION=+
MLTTQSTTVNPLLTSPQRIRRHDDDMAALRTLQEMPPPLEDPSIQQQQQQHNTTTSDDSQEEHDDDDDDDDDDVDTAFRQMMNRGSYLRQLRLIALEDERERQAAATHNQVIHGNNSRVNYDDDVDCEEKKEEYDESLPSFFSCNDVTSLHDVVAQEKMMEDKVRILPTTNEKVLDYNSYLAHQRYYDDLKHIDIKYMDFGNIANASGDVDGGRLIVEQRKSLGKGGFCWDAGFILGEHVIAHEEEWNTAVVGDGDDNAAATSSASPPRIVELGAGTGLTGLMIAKATESDVVITDLPELEGLMEDNVRRNFGGERRLEDDDVVGDSDASSSMTSSTAARDRSAAGGTVSSRVLRWGVEEDYLGAPYDVIVGADIVTSLYDPQALARALHALSGPGTRIYISGKARLDRPHEEFDAEMERLFERVERIWEPSSRLRSPDVFIIVAGGKRL